MTDKRPIWQFGGIAVILYIAAFAMVPSGAPDSGSSGIQIYGYEAANRHRLLGSALVLLAAVALLTLFAASLYRVFRKAEGGDGWLATAGLASFLVAAAMFAMGCVALLTAVYRPDPNTARAFTDLGWIGFNSSGFLFGAWIMIISAATLNNELIPKWTAYIGVPIALINMFGPIALSAGTGFFSPQGTFTYIVGYSFPVWMIAIAAGVWREEAMASKAVAAT